MATNNDIPGAQLQPSLFDLNVEIELHKATGPLTSSRDEEMACQLVLSCILGSIRTQPPLMRDRNMALLHGKVFAISCERRKAL